MDLNKLTSEKRNERTRDLDLMDVRQILTIMNEEDHNVIEAVKEALPQIESLIDQTIQAYRNGGRIIYIGAGTSGRMGLMDAVEVVPTFNSERFVGLIAGGDYAFVKAVEGAEDSRQLGEDDLKKIDLNEKDFVIGIAASGRTPYVIGGLDYARSIGCKTGCVCCNSNTEIGRHCDYPIELTPGPEVLNGSTRLKAGTCQKIVLNMISTVTMTKNHKVYSNLMVDVKATNEKLTERCHRIVMEATSCSHEEAEAALKQCGYRCKTAILMILLQIDAKQAQEKLERSKGDVREALK